MKVAILTLRIHSNFGYLMQMYALQSVVKKLGHEPFTFKIRLEESSIFSKFKQIIYNCYLRFIKGQNVTIFKRFLSEKEQDLLNVNTWDFVNNNVQLTEPFKTPKDFYRFDTNKFDAYIVGSDQVWREPYSICLPLYFFSFLTGNQRRMSYAASFGKGDVDEYSAKQKKNCGLLLKRFNTITVRETSGINICRDVFGVEAKKVVDPTLLLDSKEYLKMAEMGKYNSFRTPYLFVYMLDLPEDRLKIIQDFANKYELTVINLLPPSIPKYTVDLDKYRYPHVYDILSAIANSTYIITDSFHVSVFSMLFNKQFYVFLNNKRGINRIETLLNDYCISGRIIKDNNIELSDIDYNRINPIIEKNRVASLMILKAFLND